MQLAINLLPYVGLGIGLIVFLGLFCQLSRTVARLRARLGKCEAQIQQTGDIVNRINGLQDRIHDLEAETPARPGSANGSLNGTVRSKVLKMHRLGQPLEKISDNLKVPKGEVDLLVKVHQIVMRPYEEPSAAKGEAS